MKPVPARRTRPTASFMFQRVSRIVALGFGAGLSPVAPGTVGTLWAWVVWRGLHAFLSEPALVGVIVLSFALGAWACDRTGESLGVHDHGAIVWDEVVAFWIVLLFTPATVGWQLLAFAAFRVFDIVKPPPIRQVDQSIRNGFGVMFDDLLAALYALVVVAACRGGW